jgi:K+-transporting ATPase ATPase A chain
MAAWYAAAQLGVVVVVLALVHRPLGDYMARVYTSAHHTRVEKFAYRVIGVNPDADHAWRTYVRALLMFSAVGVVILYGLQRLQEWLPYALGLSAVSERVSITTAVSFVTNTNWQSYAPETTVGFSVQVLGLVVQNFVSAAVGIAVAVALVRGFARVGSSGIGNFWVDLVRGCIRVLLPLSLAAALVLVIAGVVQSLDGFTDVTTLTGGSQAVPGGPVASQEAIKDLGTNGGGFFNANSAHPFENPAPWTSVFQVILMLAIPFSLPRTFGVMVGKPAQGYAILAAMASIYLVSVASLTALEFGGAGTAPELAGAAMEGKEQRFGLAGSALYAASTTLTSTGSVNSMHDSYTGFGGGVTMLNMMLGEVAPGGVGAGLYGMLVLAVISVFVGGLLVGRTPEYLGKRIGKRQIQLASVAILVTPTLILAGMAGSFGIPGVRAGIESSALANEGHHGLSEVLYAFTSAANNNGSAFAGLTADSYWFTTALSLAMVLGRFLPIILVLALAGSLAAQDRRPENSATLPTHTPLFVGLLVGVTLIVTALTYLPVLALGPIAEGLLS